ncbi:ISL3 family transposase [Bacillota bacterium]
MNISNELQLPEFNIISKKEESGFLHYNVEPISNPLKCPHCNSSEIVKNGGIERFLRDMPLYGKPVAITILSNRFKCKRCEQTFTASFDVAADRSKITNRLKEDIKKRCLSGTISNLSAESGLSVATISRLIDEHIEEKESSWQYYTPEILGLSTIMLGKKQRTLCVDIKRHGAIDILEKADRNSIYDYLTSKLTPGNIEGIVIDFNNPHRDAAYKACPGVNLVIDKYYTFREISRATNQELKRLNNGSLRWLILKNSANLSPSESDELKSGLLGSTHLNDIYETKERLYNIYKYKTDVEAERAFDLIVKTLPGDCKHFKELVHKIDDFRVEVFSFFESPYSSSCIQNAAKAVISIEKQGTGYSFKNFRARILFGKDRKEAKVIIKKPVYVKNNHNSGTCFKMITGWENDVAHYVETERVLGNYVEIESLEDIF